MFYGDSALYGDWYGLECGHKFFGAEHILFGTDFPMDLNNGDKFIKKTIEAVYRMNIPDNDKALIFEGNAKRILRLNI
jgi:predicted TIM-barrel fold metal-dependent hydrolase